jgi:hypothetical protein
MSRPEPALRRPFTTGQRGVSSEMGTPPASQVLINYQDPA